uniref:NET domain-containing protein n=1 Tax=Macrostomum lignano TaxID=282301 RepID=A0A1I8I4A2_9PLAT
DVELRGCCSSGEEEAADAAGDSTDAHRRKTDIAAALVSSSLCKSTSATDAAVVSSNSKGGGGGSGCCAFYSEAEEFIKGSSGGRCQHQHLLLDAAQYPQNYQVPQHQHSHHQPAASDADKATGDSTTGNENGRFCDCCYCEFIEGAKAGKERAAKREAKKTRQKAARKAAEPAATSPAAGRQRQQQQRQRDVENQTPVRGGKLQDAADPNSGNGRSANGDRQRMLGRQELEGLNRRDDLDDDQLFDDDDVDPVVEQFKSFVMNCQTPKERQKVRLDLDSLSMLMKK